MQASKPKKDNKQSSSSLPNPPGGKTSLVHYFKPLTTLLAEKIEEITLTCV